MGKTRKLLGSVAVIQLAVAVYTLSGVMGKLASGYPFLSFPFIAFYALEILILGIYAVAWQQIIRRTDLSVAYANRALALLWSLGWSALLFHEGITLRNLLGAALVIAGVMIVNTGEAGKKDA